MNPIATTDIRICITDMISSCVPCTLCIVVFLVFYAVVLYEICFYGLYTQEELLQISAYQIKYWITHTTAIWYICCLNIYIHLIKTKQECDKSKYVGFTFQMVTPSVSMTPFQSKNSKDRNHLHSYFNTALPPAVQSFRHLIDISINRSEIYFAITLT